MLRTVPSSSEVAVLKEQQEFPRTEELNVGSVNILAQADAMLRDENIFFSFPYRTKRIDRPWEFDPIENKSWPRRHYTEHKLHDTDTPKDVKIVFEINRFKDLPILGQAALLTSDEKYAFEVERRMLSWIEDNPFALSVNWSSALEISIRLISWTATLLLLKKAGFNTADNPKIQRSIYEQVCFLSADLGTDKVISTNHLIGEAVGLFIISSLWEFDKNENYAQAAKRMLEREIIKQTFPDGVTREASSWYHQFVTHFFDLANRVATSQKNPFDQQFQTRLSGMKSFLPAMTVANRIVRYGDADDGWALFLEGDLERWKNVIFGASSVSATAATRNYYPDTKLVAAHLGDAFLILRAGAFGMGGAGFSSHAHDDFLSPIIYFSGKPVLADPGTFIYSGDPKKRRQYRIASAHNGIIFGDTIAALPKKQFGWLKVRPDAIIHETAFTDSGAKVTASYGEWPQHLRTIKLSQNNAVIEDRFQEPISTKCKWMFHLAPEWELDNGTSPDGNYRFRNASGEHLYIVLRGNFETTKIEPYDYSPSYLVSVPGTMLRLTASNPSDIYSIELTLSKHA